MSSEVNETEPVGRTHDQGPSDAFGAFMQRGWAPSELPELLGAIKTST